MGGALAVGALMIGSYGTLGIGPATADPVSAPASAGEAVQRLIDLSRQSEQLNQQALNAQADLDTKLAAANAADQKAGAAAAALDAAKAEIARYRPVIDRAATSALLGSRTNRLTSLLVSNSPQQLLDQMSIVDFVGARTNDQLGQYEKATDAAAAADGAARTAAEAARAASAAADTVRSDLESKRAALQGSMAGVIAAWGQLSAGDKSALAGSMFPPGFDRDSMLRGLVPGSGTSALAAGLTRVGDPYVWGATGPDQFDCSGLVQWAFHQVGKNVPRTSQQQSGFGTPVDEKDLQPGDVVFFYSDISHVGIYAGNGLMLHASTFGIPVQVAPMGSTPFHSARRF
ncbi:NlpC/P60 family protein [Nocardia seriolae]|uniref:Protein p60 n=2 Tax=Nocardia seriolae TaxID=37332 RepID=A0ABC9YQ87_9NOCA|nr:NlpC/P60 family protein [Nocardia seriolae]WNJ61532.1 NlpC/P60 family protein [Nocardia seriolae]GAM45623.1 protein p60 precursor [Nocardia seriolae]GAP27647.1 protein p60 precursor [Nocardia seriolae]